LFSIFLFLLYENPVLDFGVFLEIHAIISIYQCDHPLKLWNVRFHISAVHPRDIPLRYNHIFNSFRFFITDTLALFALNPGDLSAIGHDPALTPDRDQLAIGSGFRPQVCTSSSFDLPRSPCESRYYAMASFPPSRLSIPSISPFLSLFPHPSLFCCPPSPTPDPRPRFWHPVPFDRDLGLLPAQVLELPAFYHEICDDSRELASTAHPERSLIALRIVLETRLKRYALRSGRFDNHEDSRKSPTTVAAHIVSGGFP
jgi:hypothetical protein